MKSLETDILVALAMLRRRINPQESPVYRLHPELLSLIASRLGTDDLVRASHISYHWRTVLLSYPSLWATIDFTHLDRALTFLTRSKSAPIHAFLPQIPPTTPLPLGSLDRFAHRIATLSVGNYVSQKELLPRTIPSLRTLEFSPDSSHPLDKMTRWYFPRFLAVSSESIDPLPLHVPRLTRFVYNSWTRGERAIDALLDFLRNCPLLEEIEINHGDDFYTRRNHDVVHLPHLRIYTHCTSTHFYLGLYDMLSCPPSCSVTLRCGEGYFGMEGAIPPFQAPTFLVDAKRVKLKSRSVDREDYAEGMVEIIDTANWRLCSTRQMVLRDETWDGALIDTINPFFLDFLKGLNPGSVEVLCIEEFALWFYEEHDRIREALGHLEHIKVLILPDSVVGIYLWILAPTEATDVGGWRCLELDTLVIRSGRPIDYSGDNVLSALSWFARRRKEAGIPLRRVSLFVHETPSPGRAGHLGWMEDLEESRRCIETFEYVDDPDTLLDWNVDDYFLDGLDHLRIG